MSRAVTGNIIDLVGASGGGSGDDGQPVLRPLTLPETKASWAHYRFSESGWLPAEVWFADGPSHC